MAATYPFLQVLSSAGAASLRLPLGQRPWMWNHSGPTRGRAGAAAVRGSGGAAVHRRCCRGHAASGALVLGVYHPGDSFGVPLAGVLLAATAAGASVIDCQHQSRHFVLDNGVTGVRIDGLSLINGRVSAGEGDDALGGCMLVGEDASLHLRNVTFRNCSAPGAYFAREREWGRDRERGREEGRGREGGRQRREKEEKSGEGESGTGERGGVACWCVSLCVRAKRLESVWFLKENWNIFSLLFCTKGVSLCVRAREMRQ